MSFTYLIILILISWGAQALVNKAFNQYAQVGSIKGLTGYEAAKQFLNSQGVYDVEIVPTLGSALSDAYDPRTKTIHLSRQVYMSNSISAVAVACHEAGHAVQHAKNYKALVLRNKMLPLVNISNRFSWILLLVGILFGFLDIIYVGIALFGLVALFQLITLPVETNASTRALNFLDGNVLTSEETIGAEKVLKAAAFTYVAALLTSLIQIGNLIMVFGGGRRR